MASGPVYTSRIRSIREVAPEVRELTLEPPHGDDAPFTFTPGQWISLHLPVGERPPLVRAYSLASAPAAGGELVLCFDRVPDGVGSEYLFSVAEGEELRFQGPLGNFVLQDTPADQLWTARFTGIVPFRSMLQALEKNPPSGRVTLLYSAARPGDLAYRDELLRAANERPWLELRTLVDQADDGWTGDVGAALDVLPELVGDRRDLAPMVCGKRDFVRPVRDFFYANGYEKRAVKWENYD